jgi:hypothetical protein
MQVQKFCSGASEPRAILNLEFATFVFARGLASSSNLFEQCLRLLQIARLKPLSEPPVNPSEQFTRFPHLALVAPEAGEAHGGAESAGATVHHRVAGFVVASWPIRHFPLVSCFGLIELSEWAWWRKDHAKARGWLLLR